MKKSTVIGLFALFLVNGLITFICSYTPKYLCDFFCGTDYVTQELTEYGENLYYSYQVMDKNENIVSKAIIYHVEHEKVKPLLVFDNNVITDGKKTLFVASQSYSDKYCGWDIEIKPELGTDLPYVFTDFFTNTGKEVAKGPSFFVKDGKFTQYIRELGMF